jgi:hypothetical protein
MKTRSEFKARLMAARDGQNNIISIAESEQGTDQKVLVLLCQLARRKSP